MKSEEYRRCIAAGMTPDQVEVVMELLDAKDEDRKESQRARWRKHQQNKRNANVSERELTLANVPREGVTRVEDNSQTQKIEPQVKEQKETPLSRLSVVLDAERARAVVDHRQRLRKPLTEHGAKLLAGKFRACPDPNAAADLMVEKGWQSIEPEWLDRPNARAGPAPTKRGVQGVLHDLVEHLENGGQGRSDQSHEAAGATVLSLPYRAASG